MPISPSFLSRNNPSITTILALLDKELVKSNKRTLKGALFMSVDAPLGSKQYMDEIILEYKQSGWFDVVYQEGNHREQDRIRFFPVDSNLSIPPINPANVVTLTMSKLQLVAGETVLLTIQPNNVDGTIRRVAVYSGAILLAQSTTFPLIFNWQTTVGVHSIVAKAMDIRGNIIQSPPQNLLVTPMTGETIFTFDSSEFDDLEFI